MPTQANYIQNLMAAISELQLAQQALVVANTASGNMITTSSVAQIQTDINTVQTAINALVPVFMGNN